MDAAKPPVEIPLSKVKSIIYLSGCLAFVAVGFFFILSPGTFKGNPRLWGIPAPVAGWGCILCFGYVSSCFIRRLAQKKPPLLIDEKGFTLHYPAFQRRTDWSEVAAIEEAKVGTEKCVAVYLKSASPPEGWLEPPHPKNHRQPYSPIYINTGTMKISTKELLKLLKNNWLLRLQNEDRNEIIDQS